MRCLPTLGRTSGAPTLLVLLPGVGMRAADFADAGFFDAATQRGLALDLLAVDLDGGDLAFDEALAALQAQILAPARRQYQRVWLGGISLGALLALRHVADTPGAADGLCLLAPYPGSRLTAKAIERQGGLEAWRATPQQTLDADYRVWQWLKQPPADLPVFLGYGTEDRFVDGIRRMAERFPPTAVCAIPGGHDLSVWQALWAHFLDRGHFSA